MSRSCFVCIVKMRGHADKATHIIAVNAQRNKCSEGHDSLQLAILNVKKRSFTNVSCIQHIVLGTDPYHDYFYINEMRVMIQKLSYKM